MPFCPLWCQIPEAPADSRPLGGAEGPTAHRSPCSPEVLSHYRGNTYMTNDEETIARKTIVARPLFSHLTGPFETLKGAWSPQLFLLGSCHQLDWQWWARLRSPLSAYCAHPWRTQTPAVAQTEHRTPAEGECTEGAGRGKEVWVNTIQVTSLPTHTGHIFYRQIRKRKEGSIMEVGR